MRFSNVILLVSSLCIITAFAKPKAVFKSTTFDCGKVINGKVTMLHAEFVVKNTGDQLLKISDVHPDCGCTIVDFDSTVAPGKSMTVKSDVNIKDEHHGPISKSIYFTSNSEIQPLVELEIKAEIIAPVLISEDFICLDTHSIKAPRIINVISIKNNLKITEITFKTTHPNSSNIEKQSDLPMEIKFRLLPSDSVATDSKSFKYRLEMFSPELNGFYQGNFTIKTNNPDMKEVVVQGLIAGN